MIDAKKTAFPESVTISIGIIGFPEARDWLPISVSTRASCKEECAVRGISVVVSSNSNFFSTKDAQNKGFERQLVLFEEKGLGLLSNEMGDFWLTFLISNGILRSDSRNSPFE